MVKINLKLGVHTLIILHLINSRVKIQKRILEKPCLIKLERLTVTGTLLISSRKDIVLISGITTTPGTAHSFKYIEYKRENPALTHEKKLKQYFANHCLNRMLQFAAHTSLNKILKSFKKKFLGLESNG